MAFRVVLLALILLAAPARAAGPPEPAAPVAGAAPPAEGLPPEGAVPPAGEAAAPGEAAPGDAGPPAPEAWEAPALRWDRPIHAAEGADLHGIGGAWGRRHLLWHDEIGPEMDFAGAEAFCRALEGKAGGTGWRVPEGTDLRRVPLKAFPPTRGRPFLLWSADSLDGRDGYRLALEPRSGLFVPRRMNQGEYLRVLCVADTP